MIRMGTVAPLWSEGKRRGFPLRFRGSLVAIMTPDGAIRIASVNHRPKTATPMTRVEKKAIKANTVTMSALLMLITFWA